MAQPNWTKWTDRNVIFLSTAPPPPIPRIASEQSLHIHRQKLNHQGHQGIGKANLSRWVEAKRKRYGLINQSPVQHKPTHVSVTEQGKEFLTEAWPQQPDGHNSPGRTDLLSLPNWEVKVTSYKPEKRCALSILFVSGQLPSGWPVVLKLDWLVGPMLKREENSEDKSETENSEFLSFWISTCWKKTIANEALNMHKARKVF